MFWGVSVREGRDTKNSDPKNRPGPVPEKRARKKLALVLPSKTLKGERTLPGRLCLQWHSENFKTDSQKQVLTWRSLIYERQGIPLPAGPPACCSAETHRPRSERSPKLTHAASHSNNSIHSGQRHLPPPTVALAGLMVTVPTTIARDGAP